MNDRVKEDNKYEMLGFFWEGKREREVGCMVREKNAGTKIDDGNSKLLKKKKEREAE